MISDIQDRAAQKAVVKLKAAVQELTHAIERMETNG